MQLIKKDTELSRDMKLQFISIAVKELKKRAHNLECGSPYLCNIFNHWIYKETDIETKNHTYAYAIKPYFPELAITIENAIVLQIKEGIIEPKSSALYYKQEYASRIKLLNRVKAQL